MGKYKTLLSLAPVHSPYKKYIGVLISLWLFIFAAQPKEFFLDGLKNCIFYILYGLKKLERSHKCVELRGNMQSKYISSIP
jgi:hypothetical protein